MGGLAAVEVALSNVKGSNDVFRFDAEYFDKQAALAISSIKNQSHFLVADEFDVSKLAGFEYTAYFTQESMSNEDGHIALTSKNIQSERLDLQSYITIDKSTASANLTRSKLYKNDVVLSYTGEYRRALVLQEDDMQLGPNVCRIRPKYDTNLSYLVSTFFNSSVGQRILNQEKTMSAQPTEAMSRIRNITIPKFFNLAKELRVIIVQADDLRKQADKTYIDAEKVLLSELGLTGFTPSTEAVTVKNFSQSFGTSGRLDAEYYQPKYEDYEAALNAGQTLADLCDIHDSAFVPHKNDYKYIELSDIGASGNITSSSFAPFEELPTRARRPVKSGQVIVSSIEGSLASCALVTGDYGGALCSTGFYVVDSAKINSETLLVLFKSEPIQQIMKKRCSGTILTAISKTALETMPFPMIDEGIQDEIADLVKKSFTYRRQSERLLETAKQAAEMAIEQGEANAIEFLSEDRL